MPIEQRVVTGSKIGGGNKIGGGASASRDVEPDSPKAKAKKPKKKLMIIVLVAVLAIGGGGAYFFLGKGEKDTAEPPPEKGAVLTIEPVSLNLAEGHYLRLGLGLQLTADVGTEVPDTAEALDLAIATFSGHTVAEVTDPATREALTAQLVAALAIAYDGEVMDVYLTNYVTQ